MHLLDPLAADYNRLCDFFSRIYNKNAIALLGAGASVTNKKFLSQDIIDLYQTKISKDFETNDIIKFVDILQATPDLRRNDFDRFVVDQLSKLRPNEGHNIMVTIPWKQIITTNYDTLIEEASDEAIRSRRTHFRLHVVRTKKQLEYQQSDAEINYIKLNGCKTDLSLYPLVFSSEDFEKQTPFYRRVTSTYKQFSNEVLFISFGYSFSDIFSEKLLNRVASSDARQKRLLVCVDPFINQQRLSYLEKNHIAVVKLSFEDFFLQYKRWFEENHKNYLKNLQTFTNPDNSKIRVEITSRLYLDNNIIQLKDDYKTPNKIKKSEFYSGEEPTYQVVVDDFDVIRQNQQEKLISLLSASFNLAGSSIPRLILINGDFGVGKTTFTLRAIREYLRISDVTLAFELINSSQVKIGALSKLIEESTATQFIFYCDNIETDSIFKSFNELRVELAAQQFGDIKIVFVSSIRNNILSKFKNHSKLNIINLEEVQYNPIYSEQELIRLVENLKEVNMLHYRDTAERNAILRNINDNYKGDSFITLYKLIEHGNHYRLLEKAFLELSPDVKTAFKLTALVHRFNMLCPVSIIKDASKINDWNDFTDRVLRGDGRGILFQVSQSTNRAAPDLYFRTKHAIIAEALVSSFMKNTERNSLYKAIFSSAIFTETNARFVVDLIKSIRNVSFPKNRVVMN